MRTWSVWNEGFVWNKSTYKYLGMDYQTFEEAMKAAVVARSLLPDAVYSIRDSDGGKVMVGSMDEASPSFRPEDVQAKRTLAEFDPKRVGLTMEVGFAGTNRKVGKAASMWRDEIAKALGEAHERYMWEPLSVKAKSPLWVDQLADAVMRDVFGVGVETPKVEPEAEPDRNGDVVVMTGNNLANHQIKFTHGFTARIESDWGPVNTVPGPLVLSEKAKGKGGVEFVEFNASRVTVLDSMDSEPCPKCEGKGQVYSDFNAMWLPCRACGGKS